MSKKILAITFVIMLAAIVSVSAEGRWQKVINTDEYRYYFDTLTISYGRTAPENKRDEIKPDKNIIDFYAQKVYWNPQNTAAILEQLDSGIDWSQVSYSVAEYRYDIKNKKIYQGNISFFDANSMIIGTITRSTWQKIIKGSDDEKIYDYIAEYAKKHDRELKRRS
ncbi:hypothetical protein [Pectinatus haikarae]|uniref:hypothetical protein n=1 Tax=Pectinatus haikarae TaxID=349096 RepID=UPI0018C83B96|nr:hypothetical protein [Pectinatus haikarae]